MGEPWSLDCPKLKLEDQAFVFPHQPDIDHILFPPVNVTLGKGVPSRDEAVSNPQLKFLAPGGRVSRMLQHPLHDHPEPTTHGCLGIPHLSQMLTPRNSPAPLFQLYLLSPPPALGETGASPLNTWSSVCPPSSVIPVSNTFTGLRGSCAITQCSRPHGCVRGQLLRALPAPATILPCQWPTSQQ